MNNWQLLTYTLTTTCTGYIVQFTSDVACHCWARWSAATPRVHPKPVLVRGVRVRDDLRFCFTVYTDFEQDEDGDTLIHTFTLDPFDDCQTRHFYFFATIGEAWSPSTSCIFTISRPHIECYPGLDIDFRCGSEYYPTLKQACEGIGGYALDDDTFIPALTVFHDGWGHLVHRGVFVFDFSDIPKGRLLNTIDIHLWCTGKWGVQPGYLRLFKAPDLIFPAVKENYQALYNTPIIYCIKKADEVTFDAWNVFPISKRYVPWTHDGQPLIIAMRCNTDYTKTTAPDWETSACGWAFASQEYWPPDTLQPFCLVTWNC